MLEQIGIRELRDRLTATIRRVRDGETIEITHHHRPIARLTPVRPDPIDQLVEAGDVSRGQPLARSIRRFPPTTGLSTGQALEDDRAER